MFQRLKQSFSYFYQRYLTVKASQCEGWKLYTSPRLKLKLLLDLDQLPDFLIYENGVFEPDVLAAIDALSVKDPFLFIDIGAHMGQFSLYVARTYPQASVHAFEPHPLHYRQQLSNQLLNSLFYPLHAVALSDRSGETILFSPAAAEKGIYKKSNRGMASLQRSNADAEEIKVIVKDAWEILQDVFKENSLPLIIKLDIEGSELSVLHSLLPHLTNRSLSFIVELNLRSDPHKSREALALLLAAGFSVHDANLQPLPHEQLLQNGNYVFCR